MQNNVEQNNRLAVYKLLGFLQLCYIVVILLSNWFSVRIIKIGAIETDAGTLIFPLTFILANLITEVYGYKLARRAIWLGFLFNLVFLCFNQLIISLPSPDYASVNNAKFDSLFSLNLRIIIASTIAYFFAEPVNSLLVAKFKIKTNGRYMPLRFVMSTMIAGLFDSFIFGTLAFWTIMPLETLIKFNLTMWLIKVIVEIFGLSFSIKLANRLKRVEQLDTYDTETRFNLFNFDTSYSNSNNHYSKSN